MTTDDGFTGGQGRTDEDVRLIAKAGLWIAVAWILYAAIAGMVWGCEVIGG